ALSTKRGKPEQQVVARRCMQDQPDGSARRIVRDRLRPCVLEDTCIGHGRDLPVALLQGWRRRYGNGNGVRKQFCRTKSRRVSRTPRIAFLRWQSAGDGEVVWLKDQSIAVLLGRRESCTKLSCR